MNQIKSIQLGVIAICIATVPLSLAQTPRTRTNGSNQTSTTTVAPIHTGSNGSSTRAPQIGINPGNAAITRAAPNIGAHTATNPGVQTGISNQASGITGAVPRNGGLIGNSTMAAEAGTNAATGTNTNATAKAQTGTDTDVKTTQPQFFIETTQLPTLSTPTPSPTSTPSATPMASLSPAPSASVSPSPTPLL